MADRRAYIYEDGTTDAERYLEGCLDGTYVVCRHVKKLAERMLKEIREGYKQWHYSPEHAIRPVRFIENFCKLTTTGKEAKPFILEPYELVVVELSFGFVDDDGLRRFREVLIEWARKCGKTALLAALNLYMLTSDGEMGAEVYNGATTKEQAALCYGTTWDMVLASPLLKKRLVKGRVEKRNTQGIRYDQKYSYLCTISSNANNLDGLNAHFVVLDELAASRDGGATYHILKGSMGSRTQPMVFMISSNGKVRDGIFDDRRDYCIKWLNGEVEDDRFLGFLYEMDSREEIYQEEMWPKASPGLGTTKSWGYLRDLFRQAQQNPRDMPEVITKQFNMPENEYASFLTRNECHNEATFEFNPETDRYCCVGFDLSKSGDLSAAVAMFMRPGDDRIYEMSHCWIAGDFINLNMNNMKLRDAVPYRLWEQQGHITIIDGDKINQIVVVEWIQGLVEMGLYPAFVGYDDWRTDDWTQRELMSMVGKNRFEEIPAYAKVLSPAMVEHQIDLRAKRIVNNNNPIAEWCRSNVQSKTDANGNYFPQRRDLKPTRKIDLYMAELYAYIELKKHEDEYKQIIGWDRIAAI